jgi:hypothetical protein
MGPTGGGQQTAGQRTGGQQRAGHRTGRTPDGWTARSRTTNRMVDTACRTPVTDATAASWQCRPRRQRLPRWRLRRQTPSGRSTPGPLSSTNDEGTTLLWTDLAPPRRSAAGGTPPSSWRLGTLLSSDECRVERRAGRWPSSVRGKRFRGADPGLRAASLGGTGMAQAGFDDRLQPANDAVGRTAFHTCYPEIHLVRLSAVLR